MTAPFVLGEDLVEDLARWRIEEAANDYLAKFTDAGAPRPNLTGDVAELTARFAFTEMANKPLSSSTLIATLTTANAEQRKDILQQLEKRK